MAVALLGLSCRLHFPPLRLPLLYCLPKVSLGCAAALETIDDSEFIIRDSVAQHCSGDQKKVPEWKKLNSKELGISTSMIARPTRVVLNGLRKKGYEVYLVGGCVRDLILKRVPKDFDVLTSAELKEVIQTFSRSEIVGKRFPICHVHVGDAIVEVSSFRTCQRKYSRDSSYDFGGPNGGDEKDYIRWRNCLRRDFTINGLVFDPFAKLVYDYMGGLEDMRKAKVRTMIPAGTSFQEDSARILRAIRIAARLGFRLSQETARSVKSLSLSVLRLDKTRLLMEMNYMLAYGSAEASVRLLWKFGLLEVLLPIQAAYLVRHGFRRRDKGSNMLLTLFSNLDKLLAPDRPCHCSLWVAILAFHKALVDEPRDPLVVAAFSLAVHNGGDMLEAIDIAKRISRPHDCSFHELLVPRELDSTALAEDAINLEASVKGALSKMTDEYAVSKAMASYPRAPYSDLVFIPLGLYLRVCKIFECVRRGKEKDFVPKQGSRINYEMLALGSLQEVRHLFARVIFDTVYPLCLSQDRIST
ncbi:hypothetical protein Nepgr_002950 [Nepenthes gracilis]|uniref:Polynucleotide adenylyltransferase n=1 Tax=Nepenthes gracilis TaxID=150966 RepID=A0AAD3P7S8_NEPGR|nr:hypothetical protein Nepgr_002950 [Nepenthes gracilis]